MKAQTTPWNCGPASVSNALRWLGHRVGQTRLAALGTTPDGTDEEGIKAQVLSAGRQYMVIDERSAEAAWSSLADYCAPVLCCINRWTHWVCVIGVCGERVTYFDPAREEYLIRENHIVTVSRGKFMKRWYAARRARDSVEQGGFYAIAVI